MSNSRAIAGASAVLLLLAGCAAPPPPAPMAPAPMAPMAAAPGAPTGNLDGVYRATSDAGTGNSRCGTTRFRYPIQVKGGVASMASVANGTLEGPVAPDGSIAIEKGRASLRGQFADGKFNGTYGSGGGCAFTLAYSKR